MPVSTKKPLAGPACPQPDTAPERLPESHNPSKEPLPTPPSKLLLATLQPCSPTHLSCPGTKPPPISKRSTGRCSPPGVPTLPESPALLPQYQSLDQDP